MYNQISLIPEGTARRDALRLTKRKAKSLSRVTAYATAGYLLFPMLDIRKSWCTYRSYRMDELMKFFNARKPAYHTNPKMIDEVIYTPYMYDPPNDQGDVRQHSDGSATGDLLGIPELRMNNFDEVTTVRKKRKSKFDTTASEAEIYLFPYGTIVIWGMTEGQEKRLLTSM